MTVTPSIVLRIVALVLFAIATFDIVKDTRFNLVAAGLAFWVLSTFV